MQRVLVLLLIFLPAVHCLSHSLRIGLDLALELYSYLRVRSDVFVKNLLYLDHFQFNDAFHVMLVQLLFLLIGLHFLSVFFIDIVSLGAHQLLLQIDLQLEPIAQLVIDLDDLFEY